MIRYQVFKMSNIIKLHRLLLLLFSLFFFYCCDIDTEIINKEIPEELPDVFGENILITEINENSKNWKLKCDTLVQYNKDKSLIGINVEIDFLSEKSSNSHLTADSAVLKLDTEDISFYGNVVLDNKVQNFTLKCEELNYLKSKNRIFVPGTAVIAKDNHILKGYKLKSDVYLRNIEMENISGKGKLELNE